MYEHVLKLHGQSVIDELLRKKNEIVKYIDYSSIGDYYKNLFNSMK